MRVCMIANTQAVHSQRWASALAARGHEVHLVGVRPAQVEGVKVHSVSGTRDIGLSRREVAFGYLRLALRMRRLLRHIAPDVVMAHYTTTNGVLATLARAHPLLVVPWGTDIRPEPDTFRRAWRDRINNWVLRHADGVAVSSHYLAQRVLQVGHGKTPQPTVIPFGVEPDRFTPPSESQRSNGPRIGFVKHFEPRYGAEVLLDAMQGR